MIRKLNLKFGSSPSAQALSIAEPAVTVFVGPNNAGKSQVLREVYSACTSGRGGGFQVLESLIFDALDENSAKVELERIRSEPRLGESAAENTAYVEIRGSRFQVHVPHYLNARMNPNAADHRGEHYCRYHLSQYTLNLDGLSRLRLVDPKERGDLKAPKSTFARLLVNDPVRSALRKTIFEAFGLYFGIDMSEGDKLQIRFGASNPPSERTVENDVLDWMRAAKSTDSVSDGVKAFTGILFELASGDPKVVIIDEPEAFLHPSLSFKLGQEISRHALSGEKQIFVSTHSPQFLMGVIQSGARVNIVRLTYSGGVGTARLLPNDELRVLMNDPLLRSTNVLAGLFYESVIVTEADSDRAFYQEVNDRLLGGTQGRGVPNALFLNGNGIDSIHRIVKPLRLLGIPAASILDVDALASIGQKWTNLATASGLPSIQQHAISEQRAKIWSKLIEGGRNPKSQGGLSLLSGSDLEAAENLVSQLGEYGMFILRGGEVEHWLPDLEVPRNKTWLHSIFGAMGSDPNSPNYVKPEDGDVWRFVDLISSWARNPNRKGCN